MLVPWLVNDHLEKLENNMEKHKHDILKWKNVMGERIG